MTRGALPDSLESGADGCTPVCRSLSLSGASGQRTRTRLDSIWLYGTIAGAIIWLGILFTPWRAWSTRERLEPVAADRSGGGADLTSVTAIVPARNEAPLIGATVSALARQGRNLTIRVVDDESSDGTAEVARAAGRLVEVLAGTPPPAGWMGKLWALERGRRGITTPLVLLLDADIELAPGLLPALLERKRSTGAGLVSILAALRMETFWERLLMPAYVFFFKLLYPFHIANSASRRVAAAAGGCILVDTRILEELGGFGALRGALIDDCALARAVKDRGHRTWIGLSHGVISRRAYPDLRAVWDLVARSAFTELRYSTLLLLGCTALLVAAFWTPLLGLAFASPSGRGLALLTTAAMLGCYLPTLRYYHRSPAWALALPVVGTLYLAMTWSSALRYWGGVRARWRDRSYDARAAIGSERS